MVVGAVVVVEMAGEPARAGAVPSAMRVHGKSQSCSSVHRSKAPRGWGAPSTSVGASMMPQQREASQVIWDMEKGHTRPQSSDQAVKRKVE